MFSYQHIYHAGNKADVMKHLVLVALLDTLCASDQALFLMDAFAGRGVYDFTTPEATKTPEFKDGIRRLYGRIRGHRVVDNYLSLQYTRNKTATNALRFFAGSARIMATYLRARDRLVACEMHPREFKYLDKILTPFAGASALAEDAFDTLNRLLPPGEKAGLILIDPSYEIKGEYARIAAAVADAHRRWPEGVIAVWYPLLHDARHVALTDALSVAHLPRWQEEWVFADQTGRGMHGSGMVVINPPDGFTAHWQGVSDLVLPVLDDRTLDDDMT